MLATAATVYTTLLGAIQDPGVQYLSAAELAARLEEGWAPVMVDVDQPAEFAAMHLAGASNIPLPELVARQGELDPDQDVLFICKAGIRSGFAAGQLGRVRGRVFALAGGLAQWAAQGRPLAAG